MNKRLSVGALVCLVATAVPYDLTACGDKFLVVSRGTRFQRAANRQPASILIYANPASGLPKTLADLPIEATLRKARYTPTAVATIQELDAALRKGGFDLVLVDVVDSQAVTARLQGDRPPVVLPILYQTTSADVAQAKKQHQCILKAPIKSQSFLDGVDEALARRAKTFRKS